MQVNYHLDNQSQLVLRPIKALRLPQVLEKTGLSRTHAYRLIQSGKFPHGYKISERVTVWNEADVNAWLADKFEGVNHD